MNLLQSYYKKMTVAIDYDSDKADGSVKVADTALHTYIHIQVYIHTYFNTYSATIHTNLIHIHTFIECICRNLCTVCMYVCMR